MKNAYIILCLLALQVSELQSQQLSSVVFDYVNGIPVSNANVYLEGMSVFTTTDTSGQFVLNVDEGVNASLVISHISYEKIVISPPLTGLSDTIALETKLIMLGEIVVEKEKFSRAQRLKAFRQQFLGTSQSATSCVIENESKIDISFKRATNICSASCSEPIVVRNDYLGYRLSIDMSRFDVEYDRHSLNPSFAQLASFEGTIFFEDIRPQNKTIQARRNLVYQGSPAHFLSALTGGQLKESHYGIFKADGDDMLSIKDCFTMVTRRCGYTSVRISDRLLTQGVDRGKPYFAKLKVNFANQGYSEVIFFTDSFRIDKYGNPEDPSVIIFRGKMGSQRIGDLLPSNFAEIFESEPPLRKAEAMCPAKTMLNYYANYDKVSDEKLDVHQERTHAYRFLILSIISDYT